MVVMVLMGGKGGGSGDGGQGWWWWWWHPRKPHALQPLAGTQGVSRPALRLGRKGRRGPHALRYRVGAGHKFIPAEKFPDGRVVGNVVVRLNIRSGCKAPPLHSCQSSFQTGRAVNRHLCSPRHVIKTGKNVARPSLQSLQT